MDRRRLAVDMYSPVPSYQQLADQLREAITSGEIAPGEALPSLAAMVTETGLSMSTVQRAVRVLVGEGLVVTVPGRAIFARGQD
jgi:GntR family transcriptional regulator